jgi:hypothetical protein
MKAKSFFLWIFISYQTSVFGLTPNLPACLESPFGCDQSLLDKKEARVVEDKIKEDNFITCMYSKREDCQVQLLTHAQKEVIEIKRSEINFEQCVVLTKLCNLSNISAVQEAALLHIALNELLKGCSLDVTSECKAQRKVFKELVSGLPSDNSEFFKLVEKMIESNTSRTHK